MNEPKPEMGLLRRLIYRTNTVTAIIAGLGITAMVLLTVIEVVRRYFLGMPISWVLEINGYLMIFGAFLGMSYAMQDDAHVAVDVIYRTYPAGLKRIADLVVGILSFMFWVVLFWKALQQALFYLERDLRSETVLAVLQFYPMMLVVLGSLLSCFQSLLMTYDAVSALSGRTPTLSQSHKAHH